MIASINGSPWCAARSTELGLPPPPIQVGRPPRANPAVRPPPVQRAADRARPADRVLGLQTPDQVELLLEQPLVVGRVVPEQLELVDDQAPPGTDRARPFETASSVENG